MRGLKEHSVLSRLQLLLEGAIAAGAVRVKQVTGTLIALLERLLDLLIGIGSTTYVPCNILM